MTVAQIELRRGTAAAWISANTVLAAGEPGLETDTGQYKIGDGTTAWNSLNYSGVRFASAGAAGQFLQRTSSGATWASLTQASVAVDTPEAHGALRNGTTDDTAAIKAAIAAVVAAGKANGSNYGELWLSAGTYLVNGALDTTQSGRAQIPLPLIASTGQKFVLVIRGLYDVAAWPHWQQTSIQESGTTIVSNLNTAFVGGVGSASVIGGPTLQQLGGTDGGFSNMLFVLQGGITIITPTDSVGVAVDLQCIAQARIDRLTLNASITPGAGAPGTAPSNGGVGLRMPMGGNNDYSEIGSVSVEGYTEGVLLGEHSHALRVGTVYCATGVGVTNSYPDVARIEYFTTEACAHHISSIDASDNVHLDIGTMDVEDGSIATIDHVRDPSNFFRGTISSFHRNNGSGASAAADGLSGPDLPPIVTGGSQYRVYSTHIAPGHATSPSVPTTTTALKNPFYRDAMVNVHGGTVTAIAVDGTTLTGITSGVVMVPGGKTITLTYSAAPAWDWWLL